MSENDGGQPVVVDVGECRCSGLPDPHPHDEVYLAPEASFDLGMAANGAIAAAGDDAAAFQILVGTAFIEYGIMGWNLSEIVEGREQIVPVNLVNIRRLLPWGRGGRLVAERANELYGDTVITPLVERSLSASLNGLTAGSTSPIRPNRAQRRRSSKSSLPAPSAAGT